MKKTFILLSSALLLSGAAQAACPSLPSPCFNITVNSDSTSVSCLLNGQAPGASTPTVCMVNLTDVVNQVNSDSTVQQENIAISDTTSMVIQAWGGKGSNSIGSLGGNSGGSGGYAQTATSISDIFATTLLKQLFFYLGGPGASSEEGSEESHCGAGGGASTVVSLFDLSLNLDTRPSLDEALLVAGGGGGAGDENFSGTCNFGSSARGGPGASGGVAIATTEQAVNAAGGTILSKDGNCTSNGGGDWNGSGAGGSGGGGGSGASGIGAWGGRWRHRLELYSWSHSKMV